jgi:hypothetical protein
MEQNKPRWEWRNRLDWKQIAVICVVGILIIMNTIRENHLHCLPISWRWFLLLVFLIILPPVFGLYFDWKKFRLGEEAGYHILTGAGYYFIAAFVTLAIIGGICDSIASPAH